MVKTGKLDKEYISTCQGLATERSLKEYRISPGVMNVFGISDNGYTVC